MSDPFDDDGWAELARELNVGDKKQPAPEPDPEPADDESDAADVDSPYHAAVSSTFGRDDREDVPAADADEVYAEAAKVAGFDEGDDSDEGEDDAEGDGSGEESASGEEGDPGQKKRRRRRRRRRKKGPGEGAAEGETAPGGEAGEASDEDAEDEDSDALVEVGAATGGDPSTEDTTPEMAREIISNWNVPSWDEIIAGLYRPDR